METKALAFGIVGFLIGGLVVSVAATQLNAPADTGMSMTEMTADLRGKSGDEFDKAFISNMIDHHQGAIDMAKLAADNAKHDEIKNMATDIVKAQSKEIDTMRDWQKQWGYETTGHDMMGH